MVTTRMPTRPRKPDRFEHSNGDVYDGDFLNGAAHGQGGLLKGLWEASATGFWMFLGDVPWKVMEKTSKLVIMDRDTIQLG